MAFKLKQNLVLVFLIFAVLVSFVLGSWYGKSQVVCEVCPPQDLDFSLFWEAWKMIEDEFVDKDKFNVQEMIYGAISGMVNSLEDPYTVFLKPQDTKRFIEDVKGSFEGVGMEIGIRKGQLQVIAPLEGTPAQKAGLRAGDKITAVNGTSTSDITIDEAVNMIRGPKGTEVALTIFREDWLEAKEIKVVRGVIAIPSLKWELLEDNIAYLKLYHFSEKAAYDFRQAAIEIIESEADKFILDLRNNPGGYLEVSQDIAGWFLENGDIVVIEDFGKDKEQKIYRAEGNANLLSYTLVVLINEGSASASEILAGALRDNRGIQLIGEKSFGKGSVQTLEKLKEGSSLKITIAKWLTPTGSLIADKGLEPDIEIEITDEDYNEDRDPQLNKAIEIIKELR
ncbi:MAG: S41 family peptidase [bacterium]